MKYRLSPNMVHSKGFPIFLSSDEVDRCDEYREQDPHGFELNQNSDFQQRRINCTLASVKEAIQKLSLTDALKLLDLGCGQGFITEKIKKLYPDAEIAALDYSVTAIEYAINHFSGIDFVVGDAYKSPYMESYFDVVVCNNLWEHVPDPINLLAGIKPILKPGGFLIISTPSRYRLSNLIRVILGKPVAFMSKHHVTEYSVGQVVEQLRFAGFKSVRIISEPIANESFRLRLARIIVSSFIKSTGSQHQIESTVFYLFQNKEKAE
jgi:2-polyprenyl-3-methyl-5-hydroxy-6-metoxy-1,4-benzoquinol methylase